MAVLIWDYLWLGDINAAKDHHFLREKKIFHVIATTETPFPEQLKTKRVIYHHFPIHDNDLENIVVHLDTAYDIINNAWHLEKDVLLYSRNGRNRSAAIACAYLMEKNEWHVEETLAHLKGCKPKIEIKPGFLEQLNLHYQLITNFRHVKELPLPEITRLMHFVPNSWRRTDTAEKDRFCCLNCKVELFTTDDLRQHNDSSGALCKVNIIRQMDWMVMDRFEDKIRCPKCLYNLGPYSWRTQQCNKRCKEKFCPHIRIDPAKVRPASAKGETPATTPSCSSRH